MFSIIKEFWQFMFVRKKYWLLPVVLILFLLGGFIVIGQTSTTLTPFIYAIF